MKKNYLLLAGILLLAGCNKGEVKDTSSTTESLSEKHSDSENSSPVVTNTESESESESSSVPTVEEKEINLANLTTKTNIDLSTAKEADKKLVSDAFGSIATSFSYYKVFLEPYGLRMGSQSDTGELEITLASNSYTTIEVDACAYTKYDDYNDLWRTDTDVSFKINGSTFNPVSVEATEAQYATFTYTSTNPINEILIETVSGRLFINKITLK